MLRAIHQGNLFEAMNKKLLAARIRAKFPDLVFALSEPDGTSCCEVYLGIPDIPDAPDVPTTDSSSSQSPGKPLDLPVINWEEWDRKFAALAAKNK